jgi:hypothetical protein
MSTTHLPLPRRSAPALPLLGGPFHGEKYHADVPPPALRLTTLEGAVNEFYVLRTPPGDTTHQSAAYVLESLDADTTLAWLDAWREIARALPDAWQWHALRRLLVSHVACPGCGRCSGVYSAHCAGQLEGVAFYCLDCGEQRATLAACRRDTAAGTQTIACELHRAGIPGVLDTREDEETTKTM